MSCSRSSASLRTRAKSPARPKKRKAIAQKIGKRVVVKAQVHVGGRGKAGGVKLAATPDEAFEKAKAILGMDIKGLTVDRVLVAEAVDIAQEYYLGLTVNRDDNMIVLILSPPAAWTSRKSPPRRRRRSARSTSTPRSGIQDFQIRQAIYGSGVDIKYHEAARRLHPQALQLLRRRGLRAGGDQPAGDHAARRRAGASTPRSTSTTTRCSAREKIAAWREVGSDLDEYEKLAKEEGLTYVHLPGGNIGVCGNGAGLVMTTMDVVKKAGGSPNNFLDFGGSATKEGVEKGLTPSLRDPDVKGIFINVFGGITRTDVVAKGIVDVYDKLPRRVPIVIRLTGTREEIAKEILAECGKPLVFADSMWEGAQKIVELTGARAAG